MLPTSTFFSHLLPLLLLLPSPSHSLPQQYQAAAAAAAPRVTTPRGTYVGNGSVVGVDQFLSIRFAQPPVGDLRFADPVPYASNSSTGDIDVSKYGPGCLQDPSFADANGLSEDCLTLNVVRPSKSGAGGGGGNQSDAGVLLPVMVFIYGGANIGSQIEFFNSTGLVQSSISANKPVIYVSMNYRTGGFGFLYNSLFRRSGNLLNTGLKDQRLALQWVQQNIKSFGGDPNRVTLFGQSSGSFNTWMQLRYAAAHNETNKLFQGAIMESGAPASLALKGQTPSNGDGYLNATLLAVGCAPLPLIGDASDAALLKCLRAVPAQQLADVWYNKLSPLDQQLDSFVQEQVGFGVDGVWIDTPYYWADEVAAIPLIAGTTLNEGSLYGLVPTGTATELVYLNAVVTKDLNTTDSTLSGPVVNTYYAHNATTNGKGYNADPTLIDSYYIGEATLGDSVQDIPRRVLLGQHSSSANAVGGRSAPTWGYKFAQRPPLSIFQQRFYGLPSALTPALTLLLSRLGVAHASELAYVFGSVYGFPDKTAGDVVVARQMQAAWFSFAYDKNPNNHNSTDLPQWDQYDPSKARIMRFEQQGGATSGMRPDDMRLDSYEAYRNAVAKAGLPPIPKIVAGAA